MFKNENWKKNFLVVAGGFMNNGTTLDSVELLDITSPDQGWKFGMKYTQNICS